MYRYVVCHCDCECDWVVRLILLSHWNRNDEYKFPADRDDDVGRVLEVEEGRRDDEDDFNNNAGIVLRWKVEGAVSAAADEDDRGCCDCDCGVVGVVGAVGAVGVVKQQQEQ